MKKPPSISYNPSDLLTTSPEAGPALNDNWQARRDFAAVLRRLNCALLTSDVPTEQLKSITATLQNEAERIEDNTRLFGIKAQAERIAVETGQLPFLYHEMSPVMGHGNAHAPPMHIWQDDGRIHGRVTIGWDYEGPSEHVHGGMIAVLFDQLLGFGQRISGSAGPTGSLTIRYHRLTPLNKSLHLVAKVDRMEGRKKFLVGELWADDVCTASCEGVFIMAKGQPGAVADVKQP